MLSFLITIAPFIIIFIVIRKIIKNENEKREKKEADENHQLGEMEKKEVNKRFIEAGKNGGFNKFNSWTYSVDV